MNFEELNENLDNAYIECINLSFEYDKINKRINKLKKCFFKFRYDYYLF